jgi:hypothetical protein
MLAVGSKCPKINFQMQNDAGYLQLFNEIQKHIDINKNEESTTESSEERKKNAFGVKYNQSFIMLYKHNDLYSVS